MRYAQRVNRLKGWKGHLWQGRFFSSPLGDQIGRVLELRFQGKPRKQNEKG